MSSLARRKDYAMSGIIAVFAVILSLIIWYYNLRSPRNQLKNHKVGNSSSRETEAKRRKSQKGSKRIESRGSSRKATSNGCLVLPLLILRMRHINFI